MFQLKRFRYLYQRHRQIVSREIAINKALSKQRSNRTRIFSLFLVWSRPGVAINAKPLTNAWNLNRVECNFTQPRCLFSSCVSDCYCVVLSPWLLHNWFCEGCCQLMYSIQTKTCWEMERQICTVVTNCHGDEWLQVFAKKKKKKRNINQSMFGLGLIEVWWFFVLFFCRLSNWKSVTRVHVLLQLIDETREGGVQLDTEMSMSLLFNEELRST